MKFDQVSYPHTRREILSSMSSYKQTNEQVALLEASNKLAVTLSTTPGFNILTDENMRKPQVKSSEATNSLISGVRGDFQK